MTPSLTDLRAICEAATKGPWIAASDHPNYAVWAKGAKRDIVQSPNRVTVNNPCNDWTRENDATFIATFNPQQVLALLDLLEALENERSIGLSYMQYQKAKLEAAERCVEFLRAFKGEIESYGWDTCDGQVGDVLGAFDAVAGEGKCSPPNERDTVGVAGPLDASFNVEEINGRKIR